MKIPFSPPYIDEAVINEVVDSLRSGWITSGPKVKALEEEIKSFSGAKEVLCVNSHIRSYYDVALAGSEGGR